MKHLFSIVLAVGGIVCSSVLAVHKHGELRFTWALIAFFCFGVLLDDIGRLLDSIVERLRETD